MSLDVTYPCHAVTTAGMWDHQVCLSILSAFLLADGNEMYCYSLTTMKATLEDELKKVQFMEHTAGTTCLSNKGLTYANICDLTETLYQDQWILFRTFKTSWMWKSREPWTPPRRTRRTACKQAKLEKPSSHRDRVNQEHTFHWCWSTTHSMVTHTDYPTTSK